MFGLKKKKIGIAFGGGGARGFAHVGVVKAFIEQGIRIDAVAGTSAGSAVAACVGTGMSYDEIVEAMGSLRKEDFLTSKLFFVPSDPKRVEETMFRLLGKRDDFDMCRIPLAICSVDIANGKEVIFTDTKTAELFEKPVKHPAAGSENRRQVMGLDTISRAVSASCAVPGLFAPVIEGDMMLMDGGLMNNLPGAVLRDIGCDIVIGVQVNNLVPPVAKGRGMVDVLTASLKILVRSNEVKGMAASDILIKPNTAKHKFDRVEGRDELIEEGYRAAMKVMPQIKQLIK